MENNDSKKTVLIIVFLAVLLAAVAGLMWYQKNDAKNATREGVATTTPEEIAEKAVTDVVTSFGSKIKNVPLTASSTAIQTAIDQNYGQYVAPELLIEWKKNPSSAPGRKTSSPWPDSIHITEVTKTSDTSYSVRGDLLEKTSVEEMNGGQSGTYPVSFVVENQNGVWRITRYETTDGMKSS